MARLPSFDPIEYLVERRFPSARALRLPTSLSSLGSRISVETRRQLLDDIKAYEAELKNKTPAELEVLSQQERAKQLAESQAKARAEEELRLFHQPWARADFEHWSKAAHWTLDEAIALSFGKAPECVNWEKVKPLVQVSAFAYQYHRRRDLALRAAAWKQVFDPVLPGIFMAWAKRTDLAMPPELEAAVTARGVQIADWKAHYDELNASFAENHAKWLALCDVKSAEIDRLMCRTGVLEAQLAAARALAPPDKPAKPLGARERESLLKLVIGMAVGGYGYDPAAARSEQPAEIASDLVKIGAQLDVDTVRKWLKEAAELLPPQQTEHASGRYKADRRRRSE